MKGKLALGGKIKKQGARRKKRPAGKGVGSRKKRSAVKKKNNNSVKSRVIPLPKTGGIVQYLHPLLTGLATLGTAAGTAKDFLKSLQKIKNGSGVRKKLKLAPFKKGYGLYLRPYEPKNC